MNPIQLVFSVPPLVPDTPAIGALIASLEELWPSCSLSFLAESTAAGVQLVRVPDRGQWIAERLRGGNYAQVFSGIDQPAINVSFDPAPHQAQDGTIASRVTVWLPQDALHSASLRHIVGTLGDAARAWHGAFMPVASASLIVQIASTWPAHGPAQVLLSAMPQLSELSRLGLYQARATARIPSTLGWLNYWSEATAALLHFEPKHALGGAEQTPASAWSWQLTADLFDLRRADHATALLEAYRRL